MAYQKTSRQPRPRRLKQEEQVIFESILQLPAPHSETQSRLINAWKLRYNSLTDPQCLKPFYDPDYPHFDALPIAYPGLKFVIGACGTKWGKTRGCTIWLIEQAWNNYDPKTIQSAHPEPLGGPGLYWWVAPSYSQAENAFELIKATLHPDTYEAVGRPNYRIRIKQPDGTIRSVIEFKSAENPDTLRGFAVHGFVLDEAARGFRETALVSVMTTTTQTGGAGLIISTPNGRGWFYKYYLRGEKLYANGTPRFSVDNPDPYPEYFSIRMPSHTNPYVDLHDIEVKRRTLSDDQFRQEYLAQFIAESAGVFRKISTCQRGNIEEPMKGASYVMGVDLGKLKDYTVLTVMKRGSNQVVYHERFGRIDWEWQKKRIIEVATKYNRALIAVDSTGVGDAIYEDLNKSGLIVEPYQISGNEKKRLLVERLRVAMENESISYPAGSRTCPSLFQLREELEEYEYKYTPSGLLTYSAPNGLHDDCVISLALAVFFCCVAARKYQYRQLRGI